MIEVVESEQHLHPVNVEFTRRLYDPLNDATDEQLTEFAGHTFSRERQLGHAALGTALGREAYLSLPMPAWEIEDLALPLGAHQKLSDTLRGANGLTEAQLSVALEATKDIAPGKQLFAVADYFGDRAYDGKTRLTGTEYRDHPVRASAMGLHIFETLQDRNIEIDSDIQQAVLLLSVLHDATEETMRGSKRFDPARQGHFTPLLVYHTLEHFGNRYAREAADALWLMTHLERREWMPSYSDYIVRGSQNIFFCVVKALDMYDNSTVEPKPLPTDGDPKRPQAEAAWNEKLALYRSSRRPLKKQAAQLAAAREEDASKWTPLVEQWFDILHEIPPQAVPSMVRRRNKFIYGRPTNSSSL